MAGRKRAFFYPSAAVQFAIGETGRPINIPIAAPMDFVWQAGIYTCDVAAVMAGTDTVHGGFLLQRISDSGNSDSLVKAPTPLSHLFGRPGVNEGVHELPYLARFSMNSTIELVVDNLTGAVATLRLTLIGFQWPNGMPLPAPYTD